VTVKAPTDAALAWDSMQGRADDVRDALRGRGRYHGLSQSARMFYALLRQEIYPQQLNTFKSLELLSREWNIPVRSLRRARKELEGRGFIAVETVPGRRSKAMWCTRSARAERERRKEVEDGVEAFVRKEQLDIQAECLRNEISDETEIAERVMERTPDIRKGAATQLRRSQQQENIQKRGGKPLAEDFGLTPELIEIAKEAGLPPGEQTDAAFDAFFNHNRSRGTLSLDWNRGWRNWCRNRVRMMKRRERSRVA